MGSILMIVRILMADGLGLLFSLWVAKKSNCRRGDYTGPSHNILTSHPTLTTITKLSALPDSAEQEGYCSMSKASRKLTQHEIQNLWQIYQSVAPDLFKAMDESLGRPTRRRNSQKELRASSIELLNALSGAALMICHPKMTSYRLVKPVSAFRHARNLRFANRFG